ncbi:MAG: acyltransferase, partial [Methylococcaceae bacterium]|nr:acyltransferase [Methylococcaceae bacterium]
MHNPHFSYRADIDGLRALAVAAVVTFHAFPDALPGGFVGVDIFFVISGFLITHILRREIADATFSIRVFYARRIRRLFPALVLVLGVTLAVGWTLLLQDEFRMLGKHTRAAASFIANIVYWKEAGYFDADAELKPLLHLWSLGIEEQFYILWPLLIALAYRFKIPFLALACGLGLASFGANLNLIGTDPAAAFFLPHPRFWELILGGLLATLETRQRVPAVNLNLAGPLSHSPKVWLRDISALTGLVLILIAVSRMDKTVSFPGWWALPPTL